MAPGHRGVLFAAAEHGSCNVLVPVLRACAGPKGWVGLKPLRGPGLVYHKVSREPAGISRVPWDRFDLCVTGSSSTYGLERGLWERARALGKKSLCVLDQHKDLCARFGRGPGRVWPDRICVMNSEARRALILFGAPRGRVLVSGSPYLTKPALTRLSLAARDRLRQRLGLAGRTLITFCTEYIAKSGEKERYGYDELSVLADLEAALAGFPGERFLVHVRLHPNDSSAVYRRYASRREGNVEFHLVRKDPGNRFLQAGRLVLGMTSIILVEASRLGLPVISYQPTADPRKVFLFDSKMRRALIRGRASLPRRLRLLLERPAAGAGVPPKPTPGNPVRNILHAMAALRKSA